jgi:hypothetical protein
MPNFILNYTTIYSINAEGYVQFDPWQRANPWLYYSFSFLEIPAVLYGLFGKKNKEVINVLPLFIFLILYNFVRFFLFQTNIFIFGKFGDYSLLLSLLSGYGCYLLLINKVKLKFDDLFDIIIVLNFITQILFVITGRVDEYGGRYSALGSTVGDLGMICFLYLLYYCFARSKKTNNFIPLLCCIITLILSGSRTNLLLSIIFILIFSFKLPKSLKKNQTKRRALAFCFALSIFAVLLFLILGNTGNSLFSKVLNRITEFISSFFSKERVDYFENDSSFTQRIESVLAGFSILSNNPLGLSTSTIDLQVETLQNGYYTFPHSTLLTYYLLWSFGCIGVIVWLLRYICLGIKAKEDAWIILFCFFVSIFIYGSPIINSKMYFWLICMFAFCKKEIRQNLFGVAKEKKPVASIFLSNHAQLNCYEK